MRQLVRLLPLAPLVFLMLHMPSLTLADLQTRESTLVSGSQGVPVISEDDFELEAPDLTKFEHTTIPGLSNLTCGPSKVNLQAELKRWMKALRLQNWRIGVVCGMHPKYKGTHVGLSSTLIDTQEAMIWVEPEAVEPLDSIVLHELFHVMLNHMVMSRSEQVKEQTVRTLTEIAYRKPLLADK